MLTEEQALKALGEAIQTALSTTRTPGRLTRAQVSSGRLVVGMKDDDGVVHDVLVTAEPLGDPPTLPQRAEEPSGPDASPAEDPKSDAATGAAQDAPNDAE